MFNYPFVSPTSESRGTKDVGVDLALTSVVYTPLFEGVFCYQNSAVSRLNSKYLATFGDVGLPFCRGHEQV